VTSPRILEETVMSVFTPPEIEYLQGHTMGRLATVGRDGQPHLTPLTYVYNPAEDSIDLGGVDFANTKKWRDIQHNRRITFLIDDFAPAEAHAIEVRGEAEVHETGGSRINPRIPNFVEQFIRLRPAYIVSWGINSELSGRPSGFKMDGRRVDRG
jgi:pyridoxamine 5'-phosphate oxidase family protein